MKRLHELTRPEIEQWMIERQRIGTERYGDKDLNRYNAVDIVEEMLDGINITNRWINRLKTKGVFKVLDYNNLFYELQRDMGKIIKKVQQLDSLFPDSSCTDENGKPRIWWKE